MNRGVFGVQNLNHVLQEALNPPTGLIVEQYGMRLSGSPPLPRTLKSGALPPGSDDEGLRAGFP